MTHLSDDDLVLHYYGEDGRDVLAAGRHLRTCARCAQAYDALARSLDTIEAPEFTHAIDEMPALRQALRDHLSTRAEHRPARSTGWSDAAIAALVWAVSLAYPLSLQALFNSGHEAAQYIAMIPMAVVALSWACAGPVVAAVALNHAPALARGQRAATRLLIVGALVAASTPALFNLVRAADLKFALNGGLWSWYGVLTLAALSALFRWPQIAGSTRRFVYAHRVSALLLMAFLLGHVVNQILAFISPSSYTVMRGMMRLASEYNASYALILVGVAIQLVTGTVAGLNNIGARAFGRNLQTASGWYLAVFLLMHVLAGPLLAPPPPVTPAPIVSSFNLLASPRAVAQLPFLLLGVGAFLFHVGVYARLIALACMAEASVRRLSYAGALAGAAAVVCVALSLCGIHL